jgi:hypothetical protein
VSDFGGEIEYDFSRALSIAVIVQQQRTPYVSSVLSAGVGPGVGINDGSGTFSTSWTPTSGPTAF